MTTGSNHTRNKIKRQRDKSRKYLDLLYARQNSLCYWCKSATVLLKYLPQESLIANKSGFVSWRDGENIFRAKLATIDHVVPLRENGNVDLENLVLSCADCNKDRTSQPKKPVEIRRQCPICGEAKLSYRKRCTDCYVKETSAWLTGCGWEYVDSWNSGFGKWRDPETGECHLLRIAAKIQCKRTEQP